MLPDRAEIGNRRIESQQGRHRVTAMKSREMLGSILVNSGVITQAQLQEALGQQDSGDSHERFGRILVRLGYCTEEEIAKAIAARCGVPYRSLESIKVDPSAMATITPETARRYMALPIAFDGSLLVVAMLHPTDVVALDDLRILTGMDIAPLVVMDSELEIAIKNYAQSTAGVEHSAAAEEVVEEEQHSRPMEAESEKPAVQLANVIMTQAVSSGASDVHVETYDKLMRIRFRIDGVLHEIMQPPKRLSSSLVSRFKVMTNMDIAERRIPQDGRMTMRVDGKTIDVRAASLPVASGERMTLRLLNRSTRMITLEELGVADHILGAFRQTLSLPYGFILVTGPTGSGKSTTLYASLAEIDRIAKNIITVEDPVEYRMEGVNQIQINPRAGLTFSSGLRSILRSDPDVVMIGEIRDKETARIAIESSLTGHLVFSTLHTNDAAGAVSRLTEMDIEPYLTASSLACVLAQRLARVLCPSCKVEHRMDREEAEQLKDFPLEDSEQEVTVYRANRDGCMRCSNTGYRGRIGIFEILFASERIQHLTLDRRSTGEIRAAAIAEGMRTMREDGMWKVRQGITSIEEVMRVIL